MIWKKNTNEANTIESAQTIYFIYIALFDGGSVVYWILLLLSLHFT